LNLPQNLTFILAPTGCGIADNFIKQTREKVTEGTSAFCYC
jgi:uncharacterized membrane protein